MLRQRTLKKATMLEGVGLHSAARVKVILSPAAPHSGIVFVRSDLEHAPEIAAHFDEVTNTQLATSLGKGRVSIGTIEHLMAALHGLGIDNARIEIDGPEVPILDGSSEPFCRAIEEAGIATQAAYRKVCALRRKIEIRVNDKWAVAMPANRFEISGSIDWDHPAIGYQEFSYQEGRTSFRELASARTFGFLRDVDQLKSMGLAQGASLDNVIVLDDAKVLNNDGLRYPDEFIRHKILDAMGDFKLAGMPLLASVRMYRAGHDLHYRLLKAIFEDSANYEIIAGAIEGLKVPHARPLSARAVAV